MSSTTTEAGDTLSRAKEIQQRLVEIRRTIHSHPELSFQEKATAKLVSEVLFELGYKVQLGVGGTGVLAELGQGRTIIVRADMDGLPIEEDNSCPYQSTRKGVMHACGHDAHVACALGAAMLIAQTPPEQGCVRFLFQPAEESVNEQGKSGAALMIEDGATAGGEGVLALHVDPRLPVGQIALREGPVLAACDTFDILIRGVGTHGAFPELGVDTIVVAAQVVQAMQQIISRRKSALSPGLLTVGGIRSKTFAPNIVAEEVEITGTVRYFDQHTHDTIYEEIRKACQIADTLGGSHELRYNYDNPALVNDDQFTNLVRFIARRLLGQNNVVEASREMGGDDFSFLSQHMPGCYFFLGARIEGSQRKLHTPTFDIDESALPIGAAMLAECALHYLGSRAAPGG